MSLRDSVKEIAEQMDEDKGTWAQDGMYRGESIRNMLAMYYRQLSTALKASEEEVAQLAAPSGMVSLPDGTQGYHDPIGRFHSLKRLSSTREIKEDAAGTSFLELVDGGADGTMLPIEGPMPPVGGKTAINGQVYVYRGAGKAEYSEEETGKLKQTTTIQLVTTSKS